MILTEDNNLLQISLQSTYSSPLPRGVNNFARAISEDPCRMSKHSARVTAYFFYSAANVKHAGEHDKTTFGLIRNVSKVQEKNKVRKLLFAKFITIVYAKRLAANMTDK